MPGRSPHWLREQEGEGTQPGIQGKRARREDPKAGGQGQGAEEPGMLGQEEEETGETPRGAGPRAEGARE